MKIVPDLISAYQSSPLRNRSPLTAGSHRKCERAFSRSACANVPERLHPRAIAVRASGAGTCRPVDQIEGDKQMELRFTNYRCFKDTGPIGLRKVNFLVGENGSGKSAFLAGVSNLFNLAHAKPARPTSPPFDLGGFKDVVRRTGRGGTGRGKSFAQELKTCHGRYKWEFRERDGVSVLGRMTMDRSTGFETRFLDYDAGTKAARITRHLSRYEAKNLKKRGVRMRKIKESSPDRYSSLRAFTVKGVESAFDDSCILDFESLALSLAAAVKRNSREGGDGGRLDEWKDFDIMSDFKLMFLGVDRDFARFQPQCVPISPPRFQPKRFYSAQDEVAASFGPGRVGLPERFMQAARKGSALHRKKESLLDEFGERSGLPRKICVESLADDSPYPFSLMAETPGGERRNVIDMGQGASLLSHLACELLLFDDPRCYLIEQPETGLLARAQAELASLLAGAAALNCRFLIETHSEHILDRMKQEVETGGISHQDVSILFFERTPAGTELFQMDVDERGMPIDPPDSYRSFFLAEWDRILG